MLKVDRLQISYGRLGPLVLDDVTIDVPAGTCMGLIGESGSGKSTLARAVLGVVPVRSGSILLDGTEMVGATTPARRRALGVCQLVFQDPHASLSPRMTVGAAVAQGVLANGRRKGTAVHERVAALFDMVGLASVIRDRYPHELSGGQCQRVAIARAIAVEPRMLILDEVTASLDVSVQAKILNLLNELRVEHSLTYVYISHDLSIVRYFCDQVYVMRDGRIVEHGDADILVAPQEEYTRELTAAAPRLGAHRWNSQKVSES